MKKIGCFLPFERAWEKMLDTLFRPFNWILWMKLGFLAWLANLLAGGGGGCNFLFNGGGGSGNGGGRVPNLPAPDEIPEKIHGAMDWLVAALIAYALIVVVAIMIAIILGLLVAWVKSRGKFMFIDGLLNGVDVPLKERWRCFSRQGNSLFIFNIAASIVVGLLYLAILAFGVLLMWKWIAGCISAKNLLPLDPMGIGGILVIAAIIPVSIAISCLFTIFDRIGTLQMYKRGISATAAFIETLKLIGSHPWGIFKYLLTIILISMASGLLIIAFELATCLLCCIGFILLSVPYVWAVTILPLLVFKRLFDIEFASQLGEDFNLLEEEASTQEPQADA